MSFAFTPYALPLRTRYHWAKGAHDERAGLIVRCDLGGATGWGECAPPPHRAVDPVAYPAEAARLVEGLDPARDDFLQALDARRPAGRLRCGISTAWLSARAAAAGRTLAAEMARPGETPAARVPINALITEEEPDAAAERAASLVADGFRTIKIKCFADRARDLVRVRAIRQAAPHVTLRLDPNESWPADAALDQLKAMAEFGVDYVEQPMPSGTPIEAFVALRKQSPIRVAIDESAEDLQTIRPFLEAGAVDVLILKPPRVGGPDAALAIAREAAQSGVQSTITASLETAVGLYAALHAGSLLPAPIPDCGLGTARFFARDVAAPPPLVNGYMTLPTTPGLGVGAIDPQGREQAA